MNPEFPNPYLGLGMLLLERNEIEKASELLNELFKKAKVQDARYIQIFNEARNKFGYSGISVATFLPVGDELYLIHENSTFAL